MSTAAQIAANRANAKKSTGPRNTEATRFNALKHGLDAASIVIPGEDPDAYQSLSDRYYQDFTPQSAIEEFHVDTLIRSDWQRRRLQRIEAKLHRALLAEGATPDDLDVGLLRDSPTAALLRKVFAQITSLERAYQRALNDLRRIQREREQALNAYRDALVESVWAPLPPFPRNEANLPPKSTPAEPLGNPALRL